MTIGIIGLGIVGSALYQSFESRCTGIKIAAYDKFKNVGSLEAVMDTSMVFLCLPTSYSEVLKAYDKSALEEVCNDLSRANYSGLVVIKSTVEPGSCDKWANMYHLAIFHNPEFLSATTALEDFENQSHIVIGSTIHPSSHLVYFYQKYYPKATITACHATESECIKLFCNNFYAVKIQFFNELYLLCQKMGIDYHVVKEGMLKNNWISPMHTDVPGRDGQLSYGGLCFPKDTAALLQYMIGQNTIHGVLEGAVRERSLMRTD